MFIGFISMIFEGWYIYNYVVSFYLIFSPFFILTLKPKGSASRKLNKELFEVFFKYFAIVLTVVNISAFIYAAIVLSSAAYPDDVFTGLYGKSGFGSHSLSIINLAVSIYFFQKSQFKSFAFFLICGVLGFYGLGIVVFAIAVFLYNIPFLLKKALLIFKGFILLSLVVWVIYLVNPKNINYIMLNFKDFQDVFVSYNHDHEMKRALNYERTYAPRYIVFVDGTRQLYFSDLKVFLIGTSPGTYNSRTAFYLNGDFIQNEFVKKHFSLRTTYHENYVFPILNRKLLQTRRWNDGTRNQPFSSIISILLEYGFIIGFLFFYILYKRIKKVIKQTETQETKNFIRFLALFLVVLLFFQNYFEYPEIILFFVIVFKLIDIDNVSNTTSSIEN